MRKMIILKKVAREGETRVVEKVVFNANHILMVIPGFGDGRGEAFVVTTDTDDPGLLYSSTNHMILHRPGNSVKGIWVDNTADQVVEMVNNTGFHMGEIEQ